MKYLRKTYREFDKGTKTYVVREFTEVRVGKTGIGTGNVLVFWGLRERSTVH